MGEQRYSGVKESLKRVEGVVWLRLCVQLRVEVDITDIMNDGRQSGLTILSIRRQVKRSKCGDRDGAHRLEKFKESNEFGAEANSQ